MSREVIHGNAVRDDEVAILIEKLEAPNEGSVVLGVCLCHPEYVKYDNIKGEGVVVSHEVIHGNAVKADEVAILIEKLEAPNEDHIHPLYCYPIEQLLYGQFLRNCCLTS